jgi:hypothetical protein
MGSITDAKIAAWQEASGIKPATGRRAELLGEMSNAAFELIKVIELELSGIRDGDGWWYGGDGMEQADDLVRIIAAYRHHVHEEWEAGLKKEGISVPTGDEIKW